MKTPHLNYLICLACGGLFGVFLILLCVHGYPALATFCLIAGFIGSIAGVTIAHDRYVGKKQKERAA